MVFVLPQPSRLPYHLSTIAALGEMGARVLVVFCKRRKQNEGDSGESLAGGFAAWLDGVPGRCQNVEFLEEGNGIRIRSRRTAADLRRDRARLLRSYAQYLRRLGPGNPYTERWRSYLPPSLRHATAWKPVRALLKIEATDRFLAARERSYPPDGAVCRWLLKIGADVVVASPTTQGRYSAEAEFVKAANSRRVPTAIPVLSWDNLSTKGLIPCPPSALLAWNQAHVRDAVDIHGLDADSVVVTGSPFFDKWFHLGPAVVPRSAFLRQIGLPPDARYLLYLGSSAMIAADEGWLVREVRDAVSRAPAIADVQLLVRPHPSNTTMVREVSRIPGVVVDRGELPYSEEMQLHLFNVIHHAEAFVGINTSAMLDAVIVGKPGFSILSDAYRETQAEAAHFRELLQADALYVSSDAQAFAGQLAAVIAGEDPKAEKRRRFVDDFIRPRGCGTDAGFVQARAIMMLAEGKTAREIDAAFETVGDAPAAAGMQV